MSEKPNTPDHNQLLVEADQTLEKSSRRRFAKTAVATVFAITLLATTNLSANIETAQAAGKTNIEKSSFDEAAATLRDKYVDFSGLEFEKISGKNLRKTYRTLGSESVSFKQGKEGDPEEYHGNDTEVIQLRQAVLTVIIYRELRKFEKRLQKVTDPDVKTAMEAFRTSYISTVEKLAGWAKNMKPTRAGATVSVYYNLNRLEDIPVPSQFTNFDPELDKYVTETLTPAKASEKANNASKADAAKTGSFLDVQNSADVSMSQHFANVMANLNTTHLLEVAVNNELLQEILLYRYSKLIGGYNVSASKKKALNERQLKNLTNNAKTQFMDIDNEVFGK